LFGNVASRQASVLAGISLLRQLFVEQLLDTPTFRIQLRGPQVIAVVFDGHYELNKAAY
jgi:hypothetical protein